MKPKKRKQRPHYNEILVYQSLQHLNNGFYKTICGFKLDDRLRLPMSGLNTEQIRYEHRFLPFRNILAPPPVTYILYKNYVIIMATILLLKLILDLFSKLCFDFNLQFFLNDNNCYQKITSA